MNKKICSFILIIILMIFISISIYITLSNDMLAKKVENELKNTPLPINTELIDSVSIAGKLTGNGNGMQYFGAVLIKTDLSKEELENYYKQYKKSEWSFLVSKMNSNKIEVIEHGKYEFNGYEEDNKEKYFCIYSWGKSKSLISELDIRGK